MAIPRISWRQAQLAAVLMASCSLAACVTPSYPTHATGPGMGPPAPGQGGYKVGAPYQVNGIWYVPKEDPTYDRVGVASWYGDEFHQKATANGEVFDMNAVSAAHTTLPLPSLVEVTNLDNGRKLVVRVNDRGPFVGDRIIDLSHEAARQLGYDRAGLAKVRVRYVGPAPIIGPDAGLRYAQNKPLPTRTAGAASAAAAGSALASGTAGGADPVMALASASAAPPLKAAPAVETISTAPLAPVSPVASQALPPVTGSAISSAPIAGQGPVQTAIQTAPVVQTVAQAGGAAALKVQAGAFSSEQNAQRAVSALAQAGQASIEPLQRDGMTLYRVMLPAPADEAQAYALRDRVAQIGFADARVVRSF